MGSNCGRVGYFTYMCMFKPYTDLVTSCIPMDFVIWLLVWGLGQAASHDNVLPALTKEWILNNG